MTHLLCPTCQTIWECYPGRELRCGFCDGELEAEQQPREDMPVWVRLAIRIVHGEAPQVRRRWSIE